jgi:MSHA biogenesis protein MshP
MSAPQDGSALLAALFLIVLVATLGVLAVRLQANQQQITSLQLLEHRADSAAFAGLEFWAARIAANPNVLCSPEPLLLSTEPGLRGFSVTTTCTRVSTGVGNVYTVTSDASAGTYGSPSFIWRRRVRQIAPAANIYD